MSLIEAPIEAPNKDEILYIAQLNPKEKHALGIARDYLGSSFDLEKSIGFKQWLKKNSQ